MNYSSADSDLIVDLAHKAMKDAIASVLRTAKLAPTTDMSMWVLGIAMALIEAKARTTRQALPNGETMAEMIDEIASADAKILAEIHATVRAKRSGAASL